MMGRAWCETVVVLTGQVDSAHRCWTSRTCILEVKVQRTLMLELAFRASFMAAVGPEITLEEAVRR